MEDAMRSRGAALAAVLVLTAALLTAACDGGGSSLTVYSGRSEDLVQPVIDRFSEETGIEVKVRYGETAELAATILEEGSNTPADVYFGQDAGALGALAEDGRLVELPDEILERVPLAFRSHDGVWVGVSGRSRVVAYNTENVDPEELPDSVLDFTDEEWRGRVGWAPTNGSFQAFVTALRLLEGEEAARAWLEGMAANDPTEYPSNVTALEGAANGEVDVALVNHYYLHQALAEQGEGFGARNHYLAGGDPGALVNVAGAGILDASDHREEAERFLEFMLAAEAQEYFAEETFEYPLVEEVEADPELVPLSQLEPPELDLSDISDLQGTLDLLRETGVLP
jgi:iron(III) transport system substrate-binding protein